MGSRWESMANLMRNSRGRDAVLSIWLAIGAGAAGSLAYCMIAGVGDYRDIHALKAALSNGASVDIPCTPVLVPQCR